MYPDNNEFNKPFMIERIVAALSYFTVGFVGCAWLIISKFAGLRLTKFLTFHVFQSIFLSIGYVLLSFLISFIVQFFSMIPILNKITAQVIFLLNMPVLVGYSVVQIFIYGLLIYCIVTSFAGKYTKIPYVSDIIGYNVR